MKNMIAKKTTKSQVRKKEQRRKFFRETGLRALFFAGAAALMTLLVGYEAPSELASFEFRIGEPSPRSLFSPLEVTYVNQEKTDALRLLRGHKVMAVFRVQPKILKETREKTDRFELILKAAREKGLRPGQPSKELEGLSGEISGVALRFLLEEKEFERTFEVLRQLLSRGLDNGILDYAQKLALLEAGTAEILVAGTDGGEEKTVKLQNVMTLAEVEDSPGKFLPREVLKNRRLKTAVLELFSVVAQPTLVSDDGETEARRRKAVEAVGDIQETVKKEELIIQRGMRITPQVKRRLDAVQKKLALQKALHRFWALGCSVFLGYALAFLYAAAFEKRFWASWRQLILFQAVLFLALGACKTALLWPGSSYYLMPAALGPLLLALLVNRRIGTFSLFLMCVLLAPLSRFQPEVMLANLFGPLAGIFASIHLRRRVQFLKVGSAVGLGYFSVFFLYRIYQEYPVLESFQISALGVANGLLITTPLCFLLLPILEWGFNLTTEITLLELSDLNHPLLKRMIVEAPGTYHHSLVVSTLAESACEAIGANALLARVGCYFHDIGKIARAEFFTENQGSNGNRHEKLSPSMSCLIIHNHVKEGIDLGRRHKLKEPILRFIPEHQGTGVVYFFYRKAMDNAKPGEKVNPDDYRYPGPKPQSRETAVAMLADSVEAASRSMKEPSPESVRQHVRKVINDKFIDGQLDECDLTLRDLHHIQESFAYNLMAIFHTRVKYPAAAEDPDDPDLFEDQPLPKIRSESRRPREHS